MGETSNIQSDRNISNGKILTYQLQKNIEIIFNDSFKYISDLNDAVSFAYGWLTLANNVGYENIYEKLLDLKAYYKQNKDFKNLGFIIKPLISIIKMLKLKEDIISLYNLEQIEDNDKKDIEKFLHDNFNVFLVNLYNKKQNFYMLSIDEQKAVVIQLIAQI